MDLDVPEDDSDELRAPLARNPVLFDAREEQPQRPATRGPMSDMPRAAQAARDRDEEDVWAELG